VPGPYLDWWIGGIALGGLAVTQWLIERRTLGVSGFVERSLRGVLAPRASAQEHRIVHADPAALHAALIAATAAEIGVAVERMPSRDPMEAPAVARGLVTTRAAMLYIAAIVVGGGIAALQRGTWKITTTLGPQFEALWGDGLPAILALLSGGVLVGFGTRMAGGCTSGHGLSGCSRLQIGSLVSTAMFMGAAVVMTFALRGLW
jgi:uncharacterized membrane protein YedE/YeeE